MASLEEIEPLIAKKCSDFGYELFEVRFFRAGPRSILRVFIDKPGGVTIGDCEQISTTLSVVLDVENFLNGRTYTLEVSSPGIDRPLKTERDFQRIYGKEVVVYLSEPYNGKKQYKGVVDRCETGRLHLLCNDAAVDVALEHVLSGKEEIRFK